MSAINKLCPDALKIEKSNSQSFNFNNSDLSVKVIGFSTSASNISVFTQLIAEEDVRTDTFLVAQITTSNNCGKTCGSQQYLAINNNNNNNW